MGCRSPTERKLRVLASIGHQIHVAEGVVELFAAFAARPREGWGWLLFNAIVSLLLGLMIWRQFPISGVWAVWTLFGVKLVMSGAALLGMASAARRRGCRGGGRSLRSRSAS